MGNLPQGFRDGIFHFRSLFFDVFSKWLTRDKNVWNVFALRRDLRRTLTHVNPCANVV